MYPCPSVAHSLPLPLGPALLNLWTIKKMVIMVLCQGLIVYVYASTYAWHVMPKVSTQVYMLFRPHRNGRKMAKCDQFFCPTSDFFDFCKPCFFYHTVTMMWILLTKPMQKYVTTVCLHCSFARLKNKHYRSTGDQCRHNKLATLVPSFWV